MGCLVHCVENDYLAELFQYIWERLCGDDAPQGYGLESPEAVQLAEDLTRLGIFTPSPSTSVRRWRLTEYGRSCSLTMSKNYFRLELPIEDY